MPPSIVTLDGPGATRSAGRIVWSTSVPLPAVPMLKACDPVRIDPGVKAIRPEPIVAPSTSAPLIATAASTAVRWARISPGLSRPARIRSMITGRPVTIASASDERRI